MAALVAVRATTSARPPMGLAEDYQLSSTSVYKVSIWEAPETDLVGYPAGRISATLKNGLRTCFLKKNEKTIVYIPATAP